MPDVAAAAAIVARQGDAATASVEFGARSGGWDKSFGGDYDCAGRHAGMDFGLNQIASQIGVHAALPLHLLLFVPFMELGIHLFRTRQLPLSFHQIEHLSHHPVRLVRNIWQWEWHALIVWGVVATVAMPLLAHFIRRGLIVLLRRHKALLLSRAVKYRP